MFTTTAYAQAADQNAGQPSSGPASGMDMFIQILPFLMIFVVFYLLVLKPQQTKQKQLKATIDALAKGDEVVTGGGIIGKVSRIVDDNEVTVEVANGVIIRVVRSTIAMVRKDEIGKDKAA